MVSSFLLTPAMLNITIDALVLGAYALDRTNQRCKAHPHAAPENAEDLA